MNRKLMILTIVTIMAALISLGGRQALSKRSFDANYYAEFSGDIVGEGSVDWSRGHIIGSDARNPDYDVCFSDFFPEEFQDWHTGWLAILIDKKSGTALFEYRWSDEEDNNYDLSGYGYFESNKKEKTFTFSSEGEYEYKLVQWWHEEPYSEILWEGYPDFTIVGTQLEDER